jgi:hypothetical protein
VADEPKPEPAKSTEQPSATSTSPAPSEVAGDPKAGDGKATPPTPSAASKVQAEPLSDGTTPTILAPGESHRSVTKSKAGLTSVYRRADIMTTLLTFVGAVVAGGIIIGGYVYFTRAKTNTPTAAPKVTTLDKADLDKLTSFFNGNSAGSPSEILTISSSSLFKNRVAVGSDLKVTGGVSVDGTTALGDLTVDKTSTLGIVNTRGQLTVNGPLTVQSPALFNAGATYKGNVSSTGNAAFGGSLSAASITVQTLSVSGALNVNGHLNVGGLTPSASAASGLASGAHVDGSDAAGTVTVTIGATSGQSTGAALVTVNFHSPFPVVPVVVISPAGTRAAAVIEPYVTSNATSFTINAAVLPAASATTVSFNYWVVQ